MAINRESFTDYKIVGECKINEKKILDDFDWLSRIKKVKSKLNDEYYLIQYKREGIRELKVQISKEDAMFIKERLTLQQFTNYFGETTYLYG